MCLSKEQKSTKINSSRLKMMFENFQSIKIRFIVTVALLLAQSVIAQGKKADFTYSATSNIGNKTGYSSLELAPIITSIRGSYIGVGAGGGIRFSNVNEKYSLETHYDFYYGNHSLNQHQLDYGSVDYLSKKPNNFEVIFGYTAAQNTETKDVNVRLKKTGTAEYVSALPCKVITSYIGRVGYLSSSFLSRGYAYNENVSLNNTYILFQATHNVTLGFVRKSSINTTFKTDIFGVLTESTDSEVYGDLLINVSNPFPQVNELLYLNSTYPQEITHEVTPNYQDQTNFRESFLKLPVGLRVGWRGNSLKKFGFIGKAELGIYPGFYSTILESVALKMAVSYRFQHNF